MLVTNKYLSLLLGAEVDLSKVDTIHFDLDDVLADWKGFVGKRLASFGDIFTLGDPMGNIKTLNRLDDITRKEIMELYYDTYPETFHELDMMEGLPILKSLIEILLDKGYKVEILSALGSYHPMPGLVELDKTNWCRRFLGDDICSRLTFSYVESSRDKLAYIDSPKTILIDDYLKTINSWNNLGGIGIHYQCPKEVVRTLVNILI